jgi:hypothetical protein
MRSPADLRAAISHVAHDMMLFRQANELRHLRVGWTAWYPLARNVATFLEIVQGSRGDIRVRDYIPTGSPEARVWRTAKKNRLADAPAALATLYGDASTAVAHLSWRRVEAPGVQVPSDEMTRLLRMLWGDFVRCVPEPYKAMVLVEWERLHAREPVDPRMK